MEVLLPAFNDMFIPTYTDLFGEVEEIDVAVSDHGIRIDGLSGCISEAKQLIIQLHLKPPGRGRGRVIGVGKA